MKAVKYPLFRLPGNEGIPLYGFHKFSIQAQGMKFEKQDFADMLRYDTSFINLEQCKQIEQKIILDKQALIQTFTVDMLIPEFNYISNHSRQNQIRLPYTPRWRSFGYKVIVNNIEYGNLISPFKQINETEWITTFRHYPGCQMVQDKFGLVWITLKECIKVVLD